VTHCVSLQDGGLFLDKKYLYANFNKEVRARAKDGWSEATAVHRPPL